MREIDIIIKGRSKQAHLFERGRQTETLTILRQTGPLTRETDTL